MSTLLWNNRHIKHQGSVLFFKDWIIGKILYVKDIKGPSGFLTFQDICNKLGNSPNRILEYNVRAAVHTFVHSVNGCDTVDTELSDLPLFFNRKINLVKDFGKAVISMHDSVPCANGFWHRKFGTEIDKHIWSLPSLVTKETRLWVFTMETFAQYIFPTNTLLREMKVRDDQMCSYCYDVIDYIEHFFFDCPPIQKFWKYIEQYILITFDIRTHITIVDGFFSE